MFREKIDDAEVEFISAGGGGGEEKRLCERESETHTDHVLYSFAAREFVCMFVYSKAMKCVN